jgi:hypothetical protein
MSYHNKFKVISQSLPNQVFIKKVIDILSKHHESISSSTLRMKIGDSIPKEHLPPSGKFNDWMSHITNIERNDKIQVDMPYYSLLKTNVSVSQQRNDSLSKPVESDSPKSNSDTDNKLQRTINRVKTKYEEWVVEWNKFNTEDPSIDQWNILHDRYNDLNKKIQTIKNFFGRHQNLVKQYHPNDMPKRPSDTLVYQIPSKMNEIKTEPINNVEIKTDYSNTLFSHSSYFSASPLSSPPPPISPPPPPPPPPPQSAVTYKYSSQLFPDTAYSPITQFNNLNLFDNNNVNNQSNLLRPPPGLSMYSSVPTHNPIPITTSNIFDNKDLYDTLVKLRNYGLMERGSLSEKALILFEQNKKF